MKINLKEHSVRAVTETLLELHFAFYILIYIHTQTEWSYCVCLILMTLNCSFLRIPKMRWALYY